LSISDVGMVNANLVKKLQARGIKTNCVNTSNTPIEHEHSKTLIGSDHAFTQLNQSSTNAEEIKYTPGMKSTDIKW